MNAVKACPICTVQLLGRSAVTCSAVCNRIFVLHCIVAVLGVFGIQRNRQRIAAAVPVVCRCQFSIVRIGFKVVNHTLCLYFGVGVNHAHQNGWLIAVGGQNGNLIVAQFQPLQNLCGNRNQVIFYCIICALGQHLVAKLYAGNAAQFHRCPQLDVCRLYNIKICFLRGNTVLCVLGIHPLCVCHDGIASILCRVALCIAFIINGIAVIILIQCPISGQRCQHPVIRSGIFNTLIGVALEDVEPFVVNVCPFAPVLPAKFFYDNRFIHCCCIFAMLLEPEVSLFLGQAPLIAVNMNRSVVDIRQICQAQPVHTGTAMINILVVALRKIIVTIVVKSFIADCQHMIGVDGLYIVTHFRCPLCYNLIRASSIRFTPWFVCQFPREDGRVIFILNACIYIGMVQQSFHIIFIPTLDGFIGIEIIVPCDIFSSELCPLYILAHPAECFPVVGERNQQPDTFLLCLIDGVVQLLQAIFSLIDHRSSKVGIKVLIINALLFPRAVYTVGENGVSIFVHLVGLDTGIQMSPSPNDFHAHCCSIFHDLIHFILRLEVQVIVVRSGIIEGRTI